MESKYLNHLLIISQYNKTIPFLQVKQNGPFLEKTKRFFSRAFNMAVGKEEKKGVWKIYNLETVLNMALLSTISSHVTIKR